MPASTLQHRTERALRGLERKLFKALLQQKRPCRRALRGALAGEQGKGHRSRKHAETHRGRSAHAVCASRLKGDTGLCREEKGEEKKEERRGGMGGRKIMGFRLLLSPSF